MSIDNASVKANAQARIAEELGKRRPAAIVDWGIILTPLVDAIPQIITSILGGCGLGNVRDEVQAARSSPDRKERLTRRLAKQIRKERDRQFDKWMNEMKDRNRAEQRDDELWYREAAASVQSMLDNEAETLELTKQLQDITDLDGDF